MLAKYESQALNVLPSEFFNDAEEATLARKHTQLAFTIAFSIGKETGSLRHKFLSSDTLSVAEFKPYRKELRRHDELKTTRAAC